MAAPMFIISTPNLVIEQCKSGIIGSFPALNARGDLDKWLQHIHSTRSDLISGGLKFLPPFAVNQIVHPTNKRLFEETFSAPILNTDELVTFLSMYIHVFGSNSLLVDGGPNKETTSLELFSFNFNNPYLSSIPTVP